MFAESSGLLFEHPEINKIETTTLAKVFKTMAKCRTKGVL